MLYLDLIFVPFAGAVLMLEQPILMVADKQWLTLHVRVRQLPAYRGVVYVAVTVTSGAGTMK